MHPMNKFTQPTSRYPSEPVNDLEEHKELSFRSKGLTADDIQGIASLLANTNELDLSDNAIDKLSRGFPLSLMALNLSSNKFANLAGFENLRNIRMLNLQHNKISSTWGLQECVHLVHLDLTHNRIKVIEGLESLTKLKTLILNKNYIDSMQCIRSLSFNTSLEELSLKGNRVTIASNYRGFTKHLISTLKQLDGKSLYLRDCNRCPGYGARFECKNTVDDVDTETVMTQMNSHRSVSSVGTNIPPAAAHLYFEHSFSSDESVISASSSQHNVIKLGDDISDLPWRRPPSIIPKDVKGKELYDNNLNISPLNDSKHKSKLNKSGSKVKKHHPHHPHHQQKAPEPPPPPADKWDENFIYESHGSPSKRLTGTVPNNKTRPGSHRNASVSSGVLSKAILGSQRYSTPPPPPRKLNKYPLTLGVEKAGAVALSDVTVVIGNASRKVPLLASPGMVERLSPKKKSTNATPLFPGAEQYWEGHVESLEHQEQNMTNHFRDQVIQQQEENFRIKQRDAPPPPPLPSEQFENQFIGDGGSEEYYSEGNAESREYADDEGEYYSSSEQDHYNTRGNHHSAHDFDDSREYYEDEEEDYYSGDDIQRQNQNQNEASLPHDTGNLTSQQRGTFFGLYSKNPIESTHDEKHLSAKKTAEVSPPDHKASSSPSRGNKNATGEKSKTPVPGGLTSQRRGTFFGLYKKKDEDVEEDVNNSPGNRASASKQGRHSVGSSHKHSASAGTKSTTAAATGARKQPSTGQPATNTTEPRSGGLTSQRRGTFFGLYKKNDEVEEEDHESGGNVQASKGTDSHKHAPPAVTKPITATTAGSRKQASTAGQPPAHTGTTSSNTRSGGLTSQRRGTFFGLYKKKDEDNQKEGSDENSDHNQIHNVTPSAAAALFPPDSTSHAPSDDIQDISDLKKDSPEELQNVLHQMYERKIESLRNLKASREQQPTLVNN